MSYQPIENYGIVGDLHTVALVGMDGAVDFMCFPRVDSPTIFGALLDQRLGGQFQLTPVSDAFRRKQMYFPDTNMLLTRFLAEDGIGEISDFMPIAKEPGWHALVRRVKAVRGEIEFRAACAPKFDYGRAGHTVEKRPRGWLFRSNGADRTAFRLRGSVGLRIENGAALGEFRLRAGETAWFILETSGAEDDSPAAGPDFVTESFKETMNYWLTWVARSRYRGRWREMVNRSALTLKLLASREFGALVAAPTFGLPEQPGGPRNWDYRYAWVRDASFALYALMRLGYMEEAAAFMGWTEARCREIEPGNQLQVLYGIDGRRELPEETLAHWEGYRGSRPVRIGNAAVGQFQLDIHGELIDAVYLYNKHGEPISYSFWKQLARDIDWVCDHWRAPDQGIWEIRGQPREFLNSRVMCWVAIDRGIRLAVQRGFPFPMERWRQTRDEIYADVYEEFWNPQRNAFTQYKGAAVMDASALLMPLVKFIGASDPQWRGALRAIEAELIDDSLVKRYDPLKATSDGLSGGEGTFSVCSFWYVECLARAGDLRQARFIFEKALGYANHLGLYAEQLGPAGEHLGNFPQALTHLALISAAWNLDARLSR